jgi:aryl-alcohol dehydrogenase-like predicted oxidoreductase
VDNGIGVIPYFSLGSGFLAGKYRREEDLKGPTRGSLASIYFNDRNLALLDVLDRVAARHGANPAQVSLAWLLAQPGVTAPIVSATKVSQLDDVFKAAELKLTAEDLAELGR